MFKQIASAITLFFLVFVVLTPRGYCNENKFVNYESLKDEAIVLEIPKNAVYPIFIEEDIPINNTKKIYPIMCISLMLLSYFKKIGINPIKTSIGIHPFTRYLTETYSVNNVEFVDGAYGSLYLHDELMTEYIEKHGLKTVVENGQYSESEIIWMVKNSLNRKFPITVIDSTGECFLIVELHEYIDHDELIAINPTIKGEITIFAKQFQNEQISLLTVHSNEEEDKTLFDEIFVVIKRRLEKMTESIKWKIQMWYYKELNGILAEMKTMFSFSAFNKD
ncbi:MAG: hypothetical protein KAH01_06430 [Caldisericia bacterium]|nr:hypothetical protein [Caldisericia bacterium]